MVDIAKNSGGDKKIEKLEKIEKLRPSNQTSLEPNILESKEIAITAVSAAIDQKGLDIRTLDIKLISDIADYFVIISATSERHAKGITDKILDNLREKGERVLSLDGYDQAEWVLLDYGSVIVHVFYEPKRQYYSFDELWKNAPEVELEPMLASQARKFKTGIPYSTKNT